MRMTDLIAKKQDGQALTEAEIQYLIEGYTEGTIPDYQMSAFAMAVYFKGMTQEEAAYLTMAMVKSGDQLDLSAIEGVKVDKHSTGGVGDTTTLILAPLVASCGVPVAKMSGRGLGHTGGTIDKLESIEGFSVELSPEEFINDVNKNKIAVVGQSGNLTPADKKLYALRDVTGTVGSIPLIASSIMSKKIAAGADAIVLDVKVGQGAFMKTVEQARELAQLMVGIGHQVGRKTLAVLSDMSQPLGYAVGNALEVKEAIDTIKGQGPEDLTQLCLVLGSQMLLAAGRVTDLEQGQALLQEKIQTGQAFECFKEFIAHQGGDVKVIEQPELLPQAPYQIEMKAQRSGYISNWVADRVGQAAMMLGAGRATKEDIIDPAVGLVLQAKVGDYIEQGQTLAILHASQPQVDEILAYLQDSVTIADQASKPNLIIDLIS
ncbi:pyrimidine-nucleoside phosphorylase [Vaginisenegalia massiliensis]|uniref:pyrimidine-nucleoside phosphorylase n=1 Tax=Vaginisenegalia massiliensis TaxID=2058294 RepID=UPI000F5284FC|nr:pyrimidine-nucleoside phosphorylase [Vaginisenegalia massiliensis]